MTEVADFLDRKGAFFGTEFELCVAETPEALPKAGEVLLPGGGEDDDVVQGEEAGFPVEASQDAIHESGERSGSIAEAKRDLVKLV